MFCDIYYYVVIYKLAQVNMSYVLASGPTLQLWFKVCDYVLNSTIIFDCD